MLAQRIDGQDTLCHLCGAREETDVYFFLSAWYPRQYGLDVVEASNQIGSTLTQARRL